MYDNYHMDLLICEYRNLNLSLLSIYIQHRHLQIHPRHLQLPFKFEFQKKRSSHRNKWLIELETWDWISRCYPLKLLQSVLQHCSFFLTMNSNLLHDFQNSGIIKTSVWSSVKQPLWTNCVAFLCVKSRNFMVLKLCSSIWTHKLIYHVINLFYQ